MIKCRLNTISKGAAIGINTEGFKEILGIWIRENESAKYWLKVITEVRNRGVQDILIILVDGLSGFSEAIKSVFPHIEIQRCIVHQIINTLNHSSYKHRK